MALKMLIASMLLAVCAGQKLPDDRLPERGFPNRNTSFAPDEEASRARLIRVLDSLDLLYASDDGTCATAIEKAMLQAIRLEAIQYYEDSANWVVINHDLGFVRLWGQRALSRCTGQPLSRLEAGELASALFRGGEPTFGPLIKDVYSP